MHLKIPHGMVVKAASLAVAEARGKSAALYFRSNELSEPTLRMWYKDVKRPSVSYAGMLHIVKVCQDSGVRFAESGYTLNGVYVHIDLPPQ